MIDHLYRMNFDGSLDGVLNVIVINRIVRNGANLLDIDLISDSVLYHLERAINEYMKNYY